MDPLRAITSLWCGLLFVCCSVLPAPDRGSTTDAGFDVSRMDLSEEDDRPGPVLGHEERMRLLEERFPGVERLDLVRVVLAPEERRGACWSELAPPREMTVRAAYGVRGRWGDLKADGFAVLREQGWHGVYKTPAGTGFEHRGRFEHLDLTVGTELICTCLSGGRGKATTTRHPLRLRLRWEGEGHMPEVGGRVTNENGRGTGLRANLVSGNLLTYELPVRAPFPVRQPQSCSGTMTVHLLIEPPFL